jgi:hypothetical protein
MTAPARLPDAASLETVLAGLDPASADAVGRQVEMRIPICQSRKSSICENLAEYLSSDIQDI